MAPACKAADWAAASVSSAAAARSFSVARLSGVLFQAKSASRYLMFYFDSLNLNAFYFRLYENRSLKDKSPKGEYFSLRIGIFHPKL